MTRAHLITAYGLEYLLRAEREIGALTDPAEKAARAYEFFGRDAATVLPLLDPPRPEPEWQQPARPDMRDSPAHLQSTPGLPKERS